ncbi:MAG: hypothetical protein ACO3RU_13045 [Planctomycetota bacterium]
MANETAVFSTEKKYQQAAWNGQGLLVLTSVPSAAANGLIGTKLVDAGALTVAGDYICLVPLAGMVSEVEVHLKATFASGTVSSANDTLYTIRDFTAPSSWTTKTGFSSDGALTTATLQSSTCAALKGEQYAQVKITIGATTSATFTVAEYNGL